MLGYNRVILIGSLTRNPEIRYNPKGERVVKITLAIPNGHGDRTTTDHFDVLIFLRDQKEPMEKIRKGEWVLIEGKMKQRRWKTPEGQSRTKVEIIADSVEHIGKYLVRQVSER
ncbi:MAG: single-stranded DNA-binding protein [Syntrophobacterales bacterium]|nr:MAG: single-stranded DNA-binding protein [Syntrophobacterales bacterium]